MNRLHELQYRLYPQRDEQHGFRRAKQLTLEQKQEIDLKRLDRASLKDEERGIIKAQARSIYAETKEFLRRNG
jgi:hypothetical protein